MNNTLITVDPGLRGCGCAYWFDGRLAAAAYVVGEKRTKELLGDVIRAMVGNLSCWVERATYGESFFDLVVEYPRTYGGRASRGDANALIKEALVVGAIVDWRSSELVLPEDWKGQTPKEVTRAQVREALSAAEQSCVELPAKGLQHNVYDAIGIGLWWLKKQKLR